MQIASVPSYMTGRCETSFSAQT